MFHTNPDKNKNEVDKVLPTFELCIHSEGGVDESRLTFLLLRFSRKKFIDMYKILSKLNK